MNTEKVEKEHPRSYWWRKKEDQRNQCQAALSVGQKCPSCATGKLAYDGLFVLACPTCGYCADNGAFT